MKPEDAISTLKHEKPVCDTRECGKTLCEAVDTAIEALEKQIPKKIIKSSFSVAFCPSCEKSVWQNKDESQYCFRCGQALKWGE